MTMEHRGFTLLEVMAVVALMGLLAAATAWSIADDARQATRDEVIGQLLYADQMARLSGRRLGPSALCIDLDRQTINVVTTDGGGLGRPSHTLTLPRGFRVAQVEVLVTSSGRRAGTEPLERGVYGSGVVNLNTSSTGRGPTYAIELLGGGARQDDSTQQSTGRVWLLVSGLTGQAIREDDHDTIDKLLDALTARSHAD